MLRTGLKASRRTLSSGLMKRGYATATEGTNNSLKLQFSLPHETLYNNVVVKQVNLPAQSGTLGILANHVPIVEQLKPGIVEIIGENSSENKKIFVSGGFATVQPNSTLSITSVEAFPLESFSKDNVRTLLAEANKDKDSNVERVAAEARIKLEVLEALQAHLK